MELVVTVATPLPGQWPVLALLLLLTTSYQLVTVKLTGQSSDHAQLFFLAAGLLLLPPGLFALLVLIGFLARWARQWWGSQWLLRERLPQLALIAAHLLAGITAHAVQALLSTWLNAFDPLHSLGLAGTTILVYVAGYRLCLYRALGWLQGLRWQRAITWQPGSILLDCVVMVLGYVLVLLWRQSSWLLLPALTPLWLMTQLIRIPQLEKAAQIDAKTGLLNAGHWRQLVQAELVRARYFKHPLCLIMVDLDGLRTLNNSYGHLAGDAVIAGVAQILQQVREYALVGRFGGEEFALLLPETATEQAQGVAERLRRAIERTPFASPTLTTPLRATACFGIATFPDSGDSVDQLIHQADVALYQAKARGKNCVVSASELTLLPEGEDENSPSDYQAAFALSTLRPSLIQDSGNQL